jgi:aminoglycoside phosphotransferase family enzyme
MRDPCDRILQIKHLLEIEYGCTEEATVLETSKSWVFTMQNSVFKLKKQVRDDLQDLTSLRARLDNCLMESDLNRRLAPEVYLGIAPIIKRSDGRLGIGGEGETVDWLVKMQRLRADRMLDVFAKTHADDFTDFQTHIENLAGKLVAFYKTAPVSLLSAGELVAIIKDQQQLNRNCMLNPLFQKHHTKFQAAFDALDVALTRRFKLIEARVEAGWIRECHGDLRPEHICLSNPPVVFDCLEFNRNLRLVDPFSEVMFLGMEAEIIGAAWVKPLLIDHLTDGLTARPAAGLLELYETLHAMLRTRLCLAHLLVPNPRTPEKWLPLGMRYFGIAEHFLCSPSDQQIRSQVRAMH